MSLTYAFIMNSETLTPDTYSGELKTETIDAAFVAVNSMEMACETAKKLVLQGGVELIDLCGDFDEAKAEQIKSSVGKEFKIKWAKYTEEELKKVEALPSLNPYGIIVRSEDFDLKKHQLVMKSKEFNTVIIGVSGMDQAKEAAKQMVNEGIAFIELCSYFDRKMCDEIIEAIDSKVPVGFAGDLN